jgi:hypothetical protein
MMLRPLVALLLLPSLAMAEPLSRCSEERGVNTITGFCGPQKNWVGFYAAPPEPNSRYDTWILRHCASRWQVEVTGFTPFDFPSDDPNEAPPATWMESEATRLAIAQVMSNGFPSLAFPRKNAESVAARLTRAGLEATAGTGRRETCVCDPGWN